MNTENNSQDKNSLNPFLIYCAGFIFLMIAIGFLMWLVFIDLFVQDTQNSLSTNSKVFISLITSICLAVGAGIIGGEANAEGKLLVPFFKTPMSFGASGGFAVFIISFLILWWSFINENPATSTGEFKLLQERYHSGVQQQHSSLDKEIILNNIDEIRAMDLEQYLSFVSTKVETTNGAHEKIEALAEFYEDVLACEENNGPGCKSNLISDQFGDAIYEFWFTFRPYILYLRGTGGYSELAVRTEKRAEEIKISKKSKSTFKLQVKTSNSLAIFKSKKYDTDKIDICKINPAVCINNIPNSYVASMGKNDE